MAQDVPMQLYYNDVIHLTPLPWSRTRGKQNQRFLSPRLRKYYNDLGWIFRSVGLQPTEKPLDVYVVFYRKDRRRLDLDNLQKALADSMKEYFDDAQIVHWDARKVMGAKEEKIFLRITEV